MTLLRHYSALMVLLIAALTLTVMGCSKPAQGPEPLPEINIGVAKFTQPTQTWQLLAGYIPDNQHPVEAKVLSDLDISFADQLNTKTNRVFSGSGSNVRCQEITLTKHKETPGTALGFWSNVGLCMNVDYLLVPQLLDMQMRSGGELGTDVPASVKLDFYLLDVKNNRLISRSHFEETQESLSTNILAMNKWLKRKGKWITAQQLAEEGMSEAIQELGL